MKFELDSPFKPSGDQPQAIEQLVAGVERGYRFQTLLGANRRGKTFTIENVAEQTQRAARLFSIESNDYRIRTNGRRGGRL